MLQKAPVLTTPTKDEPHITQAQAERSALHIIGHHFTTTHIVELKNPKLKGFTTDAESCLDKVKDWNRRLFWFWMWILGSLVSGVAAYLIFTRMPIHDGFGPGLLTATLAAVSVVIAIVYRNINLSHSKPCGTDRMIAKAWRRPRRIALHHSVVEDLAIRLRWEEDKRKQEDIRFTRETKWLEERLGWVLHAQLEKHARGVKDAERDQNSGQKEIHRNIFSIIDRLGQNLGFQPANWKKYLGD